MTPELWQITWFSLAAALAATAVMLPPGIALAWTLARLTFPGKTVIETLISLPLVLPPVATGFLLLHLLGPRYGPGRLLTSLGVDIIFTWKAVVLAMAVMGFPLLVRTTRTGFEQVNRRYEHVAATLGASGLRIFFTVSLPLARRGVLAGALLGFSRALGEFGATIMIAGSIPGQTQTLAVSIYTFAETGRNTSAFTLIGIVFAMAFVTMWISNRLTRHDAHHA